VSRRKKTGIIVIVLGICLFTFSLPFTSVYDKKENILWNIIRSVITGEIILRESVIEYVPDRDEDLYKEFNEYKSQHPDFQNLSEDELIDKFYYENYRDKMYRMEFLLKLTKQKALTHQNKISIPYRYVFAFCVFFSAFRCRNYYSINNKEKEVLLIVVGC
jgi:hypothetical protein